MKLKGTPVIRGKSDGHTFLVHTPRIELDGESYMLVSFRDETGEHFFYQLAGMKPAEVQKIYRERFK